MRRFSRFGLKTLFIVVLVVAIPLGWMAAKINTVRRHRATIREFDERGIEAKRRTDVLIQSDLRNSPWREYHVSGLDFQELFRKRRCIQSGLQQLPGIQRRMQEVEASGGQLDFGSPGEIWNVVGLVISLFRREFPDSLLRKLEEYRAEDVGRMIVWLDEQRDKYDLFDSDLARIRTWTELVELNLMGSRITDQGLVHLQDMQKLEFVWLSHTGITDRGLPHLAALSQLKRLKLAGTRVTDKGVACLNLSSLKELDLSETDITDNALKSLAASKSLEFIDLSKTEITGKGLALLAGMPNLKTLWLDGTTITNADLPLLAELPALESLHLSDTWITDEGLYHLKGIALTNLVLVRTSITDKGLRALTDQTQLWYLSLYDTAVTDAGLDSLRDVPALKQIGVNGTRVTEQGVQLFREAKPNCFVVWSAPEEEQ